MYPCVYFAWSSFVEWFFIENMHTWCNIFMWVRLPGGRWSVYFRKCKKNYLYVLPQCCICASGVVFVNTWCIQNCKEQILEMSVQLKYTFPFWFYWTWWKQSFCWFAVLLHMPEISGLNFHLLTVYPKIFVALPCIFMKSQDVRWCPYPSHS